jgi:hypothetical protein
MHDGERRPPAVESGASSKLAVEPCTWGRRVSCRIKLCGHDSLLTSPPSCRVPIIAPTSSHHRLNSSPNDYDAEASCPSCLHRPPHSRHCFEFLVDKLERITALQWVQIHHEVKKKQTTRRHRPDSGVPQSMIQLLALLSTNRMV